MIPSEDYSPNKKTYILQIFADCVSYQDQDDRGKFMWLDKGSYSFYVEKDFLILSGEGIRAKIPVKEITLWEREKKAKILL